MDPPWTLNGPPLPPLCPPCAGAADRGAAAGGAAAATRRPHLPARALHPAAAGPAAEGARGRHGEGAGYLPDAAARAGGGVQPAGHLPAHAHRLRGRERRRPGARRTPHTAPSPLLRADTHRYYVRILTAT
eukprot:6572880-Pyramimonas_sp.AAC.1